jgi:DNA ligase-1
VKLSELVETSRTVAETRSRSQKIERLAACLASMDGQEMPIGIAFLSGDLRQGKIGLGYATLRELNLGEAASDPELTLLDADDAFGDIAAIAGAGSSGRRGERLAALFRQAAAVEQDFLKRLITGELRQGALEGILLEAVARATQTSAASLRRAAMLTGDLRGVAQVARVRGEAGLAEFRIHPLTPLSPMLAQSAKSFGDIFGAEEAVALEYKVDGARIQVHRAGREVRIFTRNLNDVTARLPEIVDRVLRLPVRDVVLDGEAIALAPEGRPHAFQTTMRRFGKKLEVARLRSEFPLTPFFFDCLHVDGQDLIDLRESERFDALTAVVDSDIRIVRRVVTGEEAARAFMDEALDRGHEGAMAKALDAPYEAGRRGSAWLKLKTAHTLDLVVIAVEWGSGRRQGMLSNLHLAARDPSSGQFVMLGKTFKGMTDEMLRFQTQKLLSLEMSRTDWTVFVRPELVVEIAFDGVQESPQYPAGLALRFARVKRYREDKTAAEADTIDQVRAIHQRGRGE